ncbi:MAG: ABC transporter ATP-binding protein [Lachnospiraceae bacterium]|nr:ABC transporter ATP-binding protein [Lachnospiraceae bacterium]
MDILSVKGLKKSFGKNQILKGIDFSIGEKEIVGFLGPNGSGKSTTIKCITGLYHMTEGEIKICNYNIVKERTKALSMLGVSIEAPALYPQLTGMEHLKMMGKWRKVSSERVREMAEYTGIGHNLKRRIGTYSMGMKMRLMLAMTMMAKPALLILDEPTNGLDPQAVFELREEMEKIREAGSSILFSSHQLSEVEKLSDRVVILNHGEMIYDGKLPKDIAGTQYQIQVEPMHQRVCLDKIDSLGIQNCGIKENTTDWICFQAESQESLGKVLAEVGHVSQIIDVVKCEMNLEEFYKRIYQR